MRRDARRDDVDIGFVGAGVRGAQPHIGAEDLQDRGALALLIAVAGVDDRHLGAKVEQGVGRSEARDADAGHGGPQPTPVGSRGGQRAEVSTQPRTHSA